MTDHFPPPPPPGYGYPQQPMYSPPPDNNMVWAILSTVMCCLPLGIVAIVKSNSVQTLWFSGRYAEAQRAADEAKKWAMWSAITSAGLGLLVIGFYVLLFVGIIGGFSLYTPPSR